MTKEERQLRHQARLAQKAIREREEFERRRPWDELATRTIAQATSLLEHPHLLPEQTELNRLDVVLRLWNYPSFTPFRVWLVYRSPGEGYSSFLREVTWDRPGDLDRIDHITAEEIAINAPTPSIQVRTVEIATEEFDEKFMELRRISLPVFVQNRIMGIDGETFGIAVGDSWLNTQLSWWSEAPTEWWELTDWFHRTKAYFEQQLEIKT